MAINFPTGATVGQLYTFSGTTWEWTSEYWQVYSAQTGYITNVNNSGNGFSVKNNLSSNTLTLKTFSGLSVTITDSGTQLNFSVDNYNAGIITNYSGWTNNGNGTMNLPQVQVALYNNPNFLGEILVYTISSGVTGSGGISGLTDNDTNYIYIDYNNGNPRWVVSTDDSAINNSSVVRFQNVYRIGNFIHNLEWGNEGAGLPNKIADRIDMVDRFARESGLSLGLSGSTGVVTLSSGIAWNGTLQQSLMSLNSQDDVFFQSFHSGGTWVVSTTADTLNNLYYDNGTNRVTAGTGTYLVNWYFRGQEINDHLYEVWGNSAYTSVSEAQLSLEPALPELITSHAFLVGRIIVQKNALTGFVESSFTRVFLPSTVQNHNDLTGLQGGTAGEYYHLTSNQFNNIALTNFSNNFTVTQNFTDILANTISATTYLNLPYSGTTNYVPKWTNTTGLTDSQIYDDGLFVGVGKTAATVSNSTFGVIAALEVENIQFAVRNSSIAITDDDHTSWGAGIQNIAIGFNKILDSNIGAQNIAIGSSSLQTNEGTNNISIGYDNLLINTSGNSNVAIGNLSLSNNLTGNNNFSFGNTNLQSLESGDDNISIGRANLNSLISGTGNIAIGSNALSSNTGGTDNIAIGFGTLSDNIGGSRNIAIGFNAGKNETGSDKLYIANSNSSTLIYGELDNGKVGINTTSPTNAFHVSAVTHPVRFDGLQSSANTRYLVANTDGVVTYRDLPSVVGLYLPISGGTVTGATIFTNGLTANTISATTYQNLPSFNSVSINGVTQFSASPTNNLSFSGINVTITSAATNTLVFSAGTGGSTGSAFPFSGNAVINGSLTVSGTGTVLNVTGDIINNGTKISPAGFAISTYYNFF